MMSDDETYKKYAKLGIVDFVCLNQGDTFNLILGLIIFFVYGFALTLDIYGNGYTSTSDCYDACMDESGSNKDVCKDDYICYDAKPHCQNDGGVADFAMGYCTGLNGPGAYPVTLILMIAAIVVYFTKMLKYFLCPDWIEKKRRADQVIMQARQESYQSQMGGSSGGKK